jgi:hypothetical protein
MPSVEKSAEYRRQNPAIIALNVRVERPSQSQQHPRELAAIPDNRSLTSEAHAPDESG